MLQKTVDRVENHTPESVNRRIRAQTKSRLDYFADHPEEIPDRLEQLDREWDIERVLETGSATLSLGGLALGLLKDRRWLILPLAVQSFFLQHALQGWCPPLPVFRRLGARTLREIEVERRGLMELLGQRRATSPASRQNDRAASRAPARIGA